MVDNKADSTNRQLTRLVEDVIRISTARGLLKLKDNPTYQDRLKSMTQMEKENIRGHVAWVVKFLDSAL